MSFEKISTQFMPIKLFFLILLLATLPYTSHSATNEIRLSKGQTVYVPVYSNVFAGPRKLPIQLAATLSIRNSDLKSSLKVTTIDYYDTNGKLLRHQLKQTVIVPPLSTHYVHIEEKDTAGGFGANYIVRWQADRAINSPVIECVMIGATGGQGISFVSQGQELKE